MKLLALLILTFPALALAQGTENDRIKGERLFSLKVRGILESKCFSCHGGAKKVKGDLDVTTRASLLKGGDRLRGAGPLQAGEKYAGDGHRVGR